MLAPISWLKDFVDIKLPLKDLMWKMTEAGLTCESFQKIDNEIVLDVEVTANRPDWMSILGIAREIAAIQGTSLKKPKIPDLPSPKKTLPMSYRVDYQLFERWSAVIIAGVTIKPSPAWMQKRLKLIGLRPINNLVDITNYVMFELGIPMHVFDYDEIKGHQMSVERANGGEKFTTVDEMTYQLPKNAMIIKDRERIIDLVGIKGGLNSGVKTTTKNILLHVTIDNPVLIRRASQSLGLRSDASAIYERGPDKGGTTDSLKRAANLIVELSGGRVASAVTDFKDKEFKPWLISLSFLTLEKILGIVIPAKETLAILSRLGLSPKKTKGKIICTVPTYRPDIKIEEDLVEEVARIYGYNQFPKTLPVGTTPSVKVPYYFDDTFHLKIKEILVSCGFSEAITLSLISKELIEKCNLETSNHLRLSNPVSGEYEYLRKSLIPSLLVALKLNPDKEERQFFTIDKVFIGKPGQTTEPYQLAGVARGLTFRKFKGSLDTLLARLNIEKVKIEPETYLNLWHPSKSATFIIGQDELGSFGQIHPEVCQKLEISETIYALEVDLTVLEKYSKRPIFKPVPTFPPQIEDLTLVFPPKTEIGRVAETIAGLSQQISKVTLTDIFQDAYTFRIWYQDPKKTLNDTEVKEIREKVVREVKQKFGGIIKN